MSICWSPDEDNPEFMEKLKEGHADQSVVVDVMNRLIELSSENFTTFIQPMTVNWEVVYGITRYGSNELIIIRDDDDYPVIDDKLHKADVLPLGLRKAVAVESAIHHENIKRFDLEKVNKDTKRYYPRYPEAVYRRTWQAKILSQYLPGRLWLRFLYFFDPL